jgi:glycosyltransferase involved in cell wall biosynthesis
MTAAPRVSVVMSVFNGVRHLRGSIDSILDQQGVDLELVVVNDGSDDGSQSVLAEYAIRDSRVRLLNKARGGLTEALIDGCTMARGRYIARQDNGDQSVPGRLLAQSQALEADPHLAFVSCWTEFRGPDDEHLYVSKGTGIAPMPTCVVSERAPSGIVDGPSSHPSVMFRREAYQAAGGYRPQFYFGQDWDLWFRLAETGNFQMIEAVLYRATVRPDSLSGRYRAAQQEIGMLAQQATRLRRRGQPEGEVLERAARIRPEQGHMRASRKLEARGWYSIGEQLRRNGDVRAEGYFRRALADSPLLFRAWLRLGQLRLRRASGRA